MTKDKTIERARQRCEWLLGRLEERLARIGDDHPDGPADLQQWHFRAMAENLESALSRGDTRTAHEQLMAMELEADKPDAERGRAVRAASGRGGEMRQGKIKPGTHEILAYVGSGASYEQAARRFSKTKQAVAKLVQRHRGKP